MYIDFASGKLHKYAVKKGLILSEPNINLPF